PWRGYLLFRAVLRDFLVTECATGWRVFLGPASMSSASLTLRLASMTGCLPLIICKKGHGSYPPACLRPSTTCARKGPASGSTTSDDYYRQDTRCPGSVSRNRASVCTTWHRAGRFLNRPAFIAT